LIFLMEDGFAVAARTTIFTVVPSVIAVKSKKPSRISTGNQNICYDRRKRVKLRRNRILPRSRISKLKMERRMFRTKTRRTFPKPQKN